MLDPTPWLEKFSISLLFENYRLTGLFFLQINFHKWEEIIINDSF